MRSAKPKERHVDLDVPNEPGAAVTPEQRRERARKAAYSRWARPLASAEQSEAASAALWARFGRQVDPDGVLPDAERQVLARRAMAAHMAGMRLKRNAGRGGSSRRQ